MKYLSRKRKDSPKPELDYSRAELGEEEALYLLDRVQTDMNAMSKEDKRTMLGDVAYGLIIKLSAVDEFEPPIRIELGDYERQYMFELIGYPNKDGMGFYPEYNSPEELAGAEAREFCNYLRGIPSKNGDVDFPDIADVSSE